ncbi:MAG: PSD1 and planctomycete cytochrome C domain-containing protein [Planctomycetales bacterium]
MTAILLSLLIVAAEAPAAPSLAPADVPAQIDFARDIRPIFESRCFDCHGPDTQEAGLRLDLRIAALEGSDNGPVVLPKDAGKSELIHRVTAKDQAERMPPDDDPLEPRQIALLEAWIERGAEWPDDGVQVVRQQSDHWAFRKPVRPVPPAVKNAAWVRTPIDRFILAKLDAEGIEPSSEADRRTLLRRLHLDLTGLPPTLAETEAFLADEKPGAYERLVDRLLASEHFGERWGRHWLDLARYADSNGYELDKPRPNAWRYRDWVIAAFNSDMPYDRFVVEQVAGDLLPDATLAQRTATGFHRMAITNTESGINQEDYRNREVVDRVNTIGAAFLGLSVGCAQCHSHKYDPIPQREYYRLYAFFNNMDEVDLDLPGAEAEREAYDRELAAHEARAQRVKRRETVFAEMRKQGIDEWRSGELARIETARRAVARPAGGPPAEGGSVSATASSKTSSPPDAAPVPQSLAEALAPLDLPEETRDALLLSPDERDGRQRALISELAESLPLRVDRAAAERRMLSLEKDFIVPPQAMVTVPRAKDPRATHVLLRGDFKARGPEVRPGTLSVLNELDPRGETPDRLDLARWLVHDDNPLAARVAVNHVWKHLFGRALVATMDDFGTQGEEPSHPELLDWLAVEFRENGWGRKRLIRTIVTSAAYRQSSKTRLELERIDPLNALVARQDRLRVEAEIVRDSFLTAGGLLHRAIGGKPIQPIVPDSIRDIAYKYQLVWETSARPERYRRGVYVRFKRSNPYPSLIAFDCPESNQTAAQRDRSNTPLQALTTLNDPVFLECAQNLGRKLAVEGPSDPRERIALAGRICLSRPLAEGETKALLDFYRAELAAYDAAPAEAERFVGEYRVEGVPAAEQAACTALARTLMNLDEFLTRE